MKKCFLYIFMLQSIFFGEIALGNNGRDSCQTYISVKWSNEDVYEVVDQRNENTRTERFTVATHELVECFIKIRFVNKSHQKADALLFFEPTFLIPNDDFAVWGMERGLNELFTLDPMKNGFPASREIIFRYFIRSKDTSEVSENIKISAELWLPDETGYQAKFNHYYIMTPPDLNTFDCPSLTTVRRSFQLPAHPQNDRLQINYFHDIDQFGVESYFDNGDVFSFLPDTPWKRKCCKNFNHISPDTLYGFCVVSKQFNNTEFKFTSDFWYVYYDTTPPEFSSVINLKPDHGKGRVTLSWENGTSNDIEYYKIYRWFELTMSDSTYIGKVLHGAPSSAGDDNRLIDTVSTEPGDYTYRVIAFDHAGNSTPSDSFSVALKDFGACWNITTPKLSDNNTVFINDAALDSMILEFNCNSAESTVLVHSKEAVKWADLITITDLWTMEAVEFHTDPDSASALQDVQFVTIDCDPRKSNSSHYSISLNCDSLVDEYDNAVYDGGAIEFKTWAEPERDNQVRFKLHNEDILILNFKYSDVTQNIFLDIQQGILPDSIETGHVQIVQDSTVKINISDDLITLDSLIGTVQYGLGTQTCDEINDLDELQIYHKVDTSTGVWHIVKDPHVSPNSTVEDLHHLSDGKLMTGPINILGEFIVVEQGMPGERDYKDDNEKGHKIYWMSAYPNPVNLSVDPVTIRYHLLKDDDTTELFIYDLFGNLVFERDNIISIKGINEFKWNGENGGGMRVAPGGYIILIRSNKHVLKHKVAVGR
ncbi:hypothetical protein KAR48_16185 [bacterium]|nr:hypothetical protein [bacterium]